MHVYQTSNFLSAATSDPSQPGLLEMKDLGPNSLFESSFCQCSKTELPSQFNKNALMNPPVVRRVGSSNLKFYRTKFINETNAPFF
mmetsp:Transcript_41366/g.63054  ORF Transcript_41366/g.63054 Transcript_41366/m.63054 type:complete len:86 (+) Transcript_41366:1812-2069(+)